MFSNPLRVFNFSTFLQTQILMLPVLLFFYQENGLTAGDFFLFQGIFSITALLFEIPSGYLGDIFPRRNMLVFSFSMFLLRLVLWSVLVSGFEPFKNNAYWIILAGEVLYSLSKASYAGVADGYIYDYLKSQNKTNRMLQRYGKMNFCMSIGTAIASFVGPILYKKYGFPVLISIEIALNVSAIGLLFFLPKVPSARKRIKGLKAKYKELFEISKNALRNEKIKYYMFYSGMLAGTTMVFVWSFQPLMKTAGIPVVLFGVIYAINHGCRALAGILLPKTIGVLPMKTLGKVTFVLFVISFLFCAAVVRFQSPVLGFVLLTFICIVIGFQLSFTMANISRLHTYVGSEERSTVASVNNMISRSIAGGLLILFKFLLDDISLQNSFFVYLSIFLISLYPLSKILKSQDA
ncbi:MAG: MFS transporter [Alphaproteobacteria bacterium]|nr:MFS transporter [Alphaproteobacteria bacterium]